MKTSILLFCIIISAVNIFPQTKPIEPGLYLVLTKDSCNGQTYKNTIVYLSDTLCFGQKPVITVNDIEACNTGTANLDGHKLYVLNIALKKSAKLKFKKITKRNVGKKMAFVIAREVVMAAMIRDPVTSGRLTVSGEKKQKIKLWAEKLQAAMHKKYYLIK